MKFSFNVEDASQVFVSAFALAVPISFSEEAWRLGETLPYDSIPKTNKRRKNARKKTDI